jgi:hypothetical protein
MTMRIGRYRPARDAGPISEEFVDKMSKPLLLLGAKITDCRIIIEMPERLLGSVYDCCIEIPNSAIISGVDFSVRETESDYPTIRIIEKYT